MSDGTNTSLSYVDLDVGAGDTDGACDDVALSDGTLVLTLGLSAADGTVVVEGMTVECDGTFDGKGVGRKGTKS